MRRTEPNEKSVSSKENSMMEMDIGGRHSKGIEIFHPGM